MSETRRMRLSRRNVASLAPSATRYVVWDVGTPGFGVEVMPSGCKSYKYFYRFDGVSRKLTIGKSTRIETSEARKLARIAAASVLNGECPSRKPGLVGNAGDFRDVPRSLVIDFHKKHRSVVYFVEACGLVKIGVSTNICSRLNSLQTSVPSVIRLLALLPGSRVDEYKYHGEFADAWSHGEWFMLTPRLIAEIQLLRSAMDNIDETPPQFPARADAVLGLS